MRTPATPVPSTPSVPATAPGLARAVYEQSRRTPHAPAVRDGARTLDHAALDATAARVAAALAARGVRHGDAVAVGLPRSWQLVCVLLGVLRLGARVVPLDAQSPPDRRDHVLTDSGAALLVHTGEAAPDQLPPGVGTVASAALLTADEGEGSDVDGRTGAPLPPVTAPEVSFLFYTSGTTGRPKGVAVRDAGVLRLARPGYVRLEPGARYACLANPAFDALSFEVWVPLLTGGCCVVVPDADVQSPERLAETLLRERVDTAFVTTALFDAVVRAVPACFAGLGQLLVGGEQLNSRVVRAWYRHNADSRTQLHNVYGPTECTTFALCHPVPRDFDAPVVPIGRPLPETGTALVVPGTTRTAAPGEVAELLLSGTGVAAGYVDLPEETARRFVHLAGPDGRPVLHYRTGDLVRRDAQGDVTYVGRVDRQVKVRGFRVEPGELEQRIRTHPAVRQAYVCTRRAGGGGSDDGGEGPNELLAFVVVDPGLTWEEFDGHLGAVLPAYMRPHRLHRLEALPLTANGKVDQAALLARTDPPWRPDDDGRRHGATADGDGAVLAEVLELAARVLELPDPRPGDTWVACGGDSLKALRLRFEIRRRWGRDLPQSAVLDGDLAALAAAVEAAGDDTGPAYPAVTAAGARSAPATGEQQRLWLIQQRSPHSRAYDVRLAFALDGAVDRTALRTGLRLLCARHPALRTGFEASADGLLQVVGEAYDPWVEPDGAAEAGSGAAEDAFFAEPFDLARPRMLRATLLPTAAGGTLLLHLHHVAVDGWSLNVLLHDLSRAYADALSAGHPGNAAGPEAEQAAAPTPLDFAVWQEAWRSGAAYAAQRDKLLAHHARLADTTETPALRAAHPAAEPGAGLLHTELTGHGRDALDRLCAELGLTRFPLLLAVYAWALYGVTGRTRLRVAAPVAQRPVREFEDSVGMFANTVLLPLAVSPLGALREQLLLLARDARTVLERQDVALADVLHGRPGKAGGGPPFDFLFVLENTDFGALTLPGCVTSPRWPVPAEAKCPLTLSVVERPDGLALLWEYAREHFTEAEAAAADALFRRGLAALTGDPTADATPAEVVAGHRHALPTPGRGAVGAPGWSTVAEGFARQVARTPAAPALMTAEGPVDYGTLDGMAEALAAELLATYDVPGGEQPCHVALFMEPSAAHVVALLALARLNLTAVPLDPSYPPALLRQILDRTAPLCVLLPPDDATANGPANGGGSAFDAVDPGGVPRLTVTLSPGTSGPARAPVPHDGARPLYTLFTSGSTGTPKGVRVYDRTLCNLLRWQESSDGPGGAAATQQFSMLSFDVSFQEVFGTLCVGGCLHLVRPGWRQDVPALLERLESAGIERLYLPFVALQMLAEHGAHLGRHPSRLREVVTAGEQLVCTPAVRRWFAGMPGARLFNHYGPTETHVVSGLRLDGDPALWPDRPAIGTPVDGAVLHVVDEAGLPVPAGCPGELLIGGVIDTPCYLEEPGAGGPESADDDGLNVRRFTRLPYAEGLFYRSGDRAAFDTDGLLHFLGRADDQLKVSGHRLEPGQVEAALLRHPAVVGAVVAVDGRELVACLRCRDDAAPTPADLRRHLAGLLPAHVRVDRFRLLAELPRTPSGKLDREAALRAPAREPYADGTPDRTTHGAGGREQALSVRESALVAAFEEATGSPVGPDETYFEAGASSLDLMRFHLRLTAGLGLRLTVADLFEHVTPRQLARLVDGQGPDGAGDAEGTAGDTGTETGTRTAHGAGPADEATAVVGMAVRAPGAPDLAAFWDLVTTGRSGIEHFDASPGLVGARSQLDGMLAFDPGRFGISPQEARLMDPQQRHLLMTCVEALAHAGVGDTGAVRVGLVAGAGENTYFQSMLREGDPAALPDGFQLALHHDKDFLATKAAYHLGLTGPALTTQTACSSSLVAVHLAADLLRRGDADVMLAGGVLVDPTLSDGYRYRPQHIFSPDGRCRPFSDDAAGTVGGSGAAVLVLKPLSRARRDGDTVYAVLTGSAVNNDGAAKLSYSAPSVAGQRAAIRTALRRSGRTGADVAYVEAHGTGTRLGDPVEADALRQALGTTAPESCALSSVKSQIGHLGAAAGAVGLVRAVLAVHHGVVPPTPGFRAFNPEIGPDPAPFHVPTEAAPWPPERERVAAVSSFGIGGTNAHVVLEAGTTADAVPTTAVAPAHAAAGAGAGTGGVRVAGAVPLLVLSAAGEPQLRADAARIADYLERRPDAYGQVLRHLQAGRAHGRLRRGAVCPDARAAVAWLRTENTTRAEADTSAPPVPAEGRTAADLAGVWLAGRAVAWPEGPAQAPWDFPPPAFDLTDHDFARAAARSAGAVRDAGSVRSAGAPDTGVAVPERRPEAEWLHQPQWVRLRRATTAAGAGTGVGPTRAVVLVTEGPADPALADAFAATGGRVVRVEGAEGAEFARTGTDRFRADPVDPAQLRLVLDAFAGDTPGNDDSDGEGTAAPDRVDWVHALPLALDGPVSAAVLDRASRACLDTPAALVRAVSGTPYAALLRPWWLSYGARPVLGGVTRPEGALLAGVTEVAPQEGAPYGHWVDVAVPGPDGWARQLAALLAGAEREALPRQLALRGGHWWEQAVLPVTDPGPAAGTGAVWPADARGDHVVLGGTGGLGTALAEWLLTHTAGRVLLLSRRPEPPEALAPWADRVDLVAGDLADEPLDALAARIAARVAARPYGLASVVHAAGTGAGGLTARRDAAAMRRALAPKLRGALLAERLIAEHAPSLAVYCSSMSAHLGGVGQFDYAAGNALLDAFAHHDPAYDAPPSTPYATGCSAPYGDGTARLTLAWDVWRETGMAVRALGGDARHQAHLSVGLTVAEGQRVFGRAVGLGLPHLLVSATDVAASRVFYAGAAPAPTGPARPEPEPRTEPGAERGAEAGAERPAPERSAWELVTAELCGWLGLDGLDPDASLYDMGADSLLLLSLIDTVEQHLGVELDLASLSHRVSLNEILDRLADAGTPVPPPPGAAPVPVEVWQEGTGDDVLCLVHPVGGDVQAYRALVSALDPRLTVALIADPALRDPDHPRWSIDERARHYLAALHARFPGTGWRHHLAGWSFGAWVAAGMAAEAETAAAAAAAAAAGNGNGTGSGAGAYGGRVRSLHLLDPPSPGSGAVYREYDETQLKTLFAAELGSGDGSGAGDGTDGNGTGARGRAYADRLARCCLDNLRSMDGHRLPRITTTPTRLWLAREPVEGLPPLGPPRERRARWHAHLPDGAGTEVLGTTHYGLVRPPYAATVAADIEAAVARSRPTPAAPGPETAAHPRP
ncbi:amino acid adenylation domain-containing protein [Streptomyces sp. Z26]|nr:non-ribosomal peptide synthetase [Streptomyces sp. Z26]RLL69343.1 amino acid adenylation domain-containing protein [Streptomyces sp. Z26]